MNTPSLTHTQARAHLHALADQRLSPTDRAALEAHLAGCAECQAYRADLQQLEAALPPALHHHLDSVSAYADLAARVSARWAATHPSARTRTTWRDVALTALGVGALALMLILFLWVVQSRSPNAVEPAHAPLPSPDSLRPVPLATFEGVGSLIGYSAAQEGETNLTVTLMWQDVTLTEGQAVSVRIEDSAGQTVAQSDVALAETSAQWNYGAYLAQAHTLTLPAGAPSGEYQLRVAVYQLQTGERIPARDVDGNLSDDVSLGALLWPIPTSTPLPVSTDLSATPCQIGCPEATLTPVPTLTPLPEATASEIATGSPPPLPTLTSTLPPAATLPPTATPLPTYTPTPMLEPTPFPLPTDTPTAFIPPPTEDTVTPPPPTDAVTPTDTEALTDTPTPTP